MINFYPNGRGTWRAEHWNGEQLIRFNTILLDKQDCHKLARKLKLKPLFVTH